MSELPLGLMTPATKRLPIGWICFFASALCGGLVVVIAVVQLLYIPKIIRTPSRIHDEPVAIVLGASVNRDGTPSDALRDRILTGVDLYKQQRVYALLLSGDNGKFHTDEVDVMKKTAMAAGVPEKDIYIDGEGYRTFESCKRAIEKFRVTQAVVVTQRFHLGRALFLCNELGIDAVGVTADRETYVNSRWFWIRDLFASAKAFWDIYVHRPKSPVASS